MRGKWKFYTDIPKHTKYLVIKLDPLQAEAELFEPNKRQRQPLWSSGQRSWLQIRSPGFDSRHYQKKK
jgi:hypothetical protein